MTDRTRAEARLIRLMERFGSKRFRVLRSAEAVRKNYGRLRTENLRVLIHEAETPMRGHDESGECCIRARLGGVST